MDKNVARSMSLLSGLYGASGMFGRVPKALRERPETKCALPGCEVMTDHNGGYCCAEHCREHNNK